MDLERLRHLGLCSLRVCLIVLTNLYCIPTYLFWMWGVLLPFRLLDHPGYWYLEGVLYKWLLSMVASWSWQARYHIVETGDEIGELAEERCLFLVNHQSTADVPLLMQAFQEKGPVLRSVVWIMDRLFRYTNFGAVSVTHGDYFITQGKDVRDHQMKRLRDHLLHSYLGRDRRWIVLFPEGGFLSKRKETSLRYAEKNNFIVLEHVTLPRVGAMELILNTLRPQDAPREGTTTHQDLRWVVDLTVAYPEPDRPLDLLAICSGNRPPCTTHLHYRRHPVAEVPLHDADALRDWVYARWAEKDALLREYYSTGAFPGAAAEREEGAAVQTGRRVEMSDRWIAFLHVFFVSSSLLHYYMLRKFWEMVPH